MKNKSLNSFAAMVANKQIIDLKLQGQIKGGTHSDPPPMDDPPDIPPIGG